VLVDRGDGPFGRFEARADGSSEPHQVGGWAAGRRDGRRRRWKNSSRPPCSTALLLSGPGVDVGDAGPTGHTPPGPTPTLPVRVELRIYRAHLHQPQPGNPSKGLFESLMTSTFHGWTSPPTRQAFITAANSLITEIRKCDPPSAQTSLPILLTASHWAMRQE
jgi:hypothetical protein